MNNLPDIGSAQGLTEYASGKSQLPMFQLICNIALWWADSIGRYDTKSIDTADTILLTVSTDTTNSVPQYWYLMWFGLDHF